MAVSERPTTAMMKMDTVMSAMRYSVLFLMQPAYPHPVCRPREHNKILELPPELYPLIAQHLSCFPTSLKSCALVSHAWLHATRSDIFHTVVLTDENVHTFLRLLTTSLCTFARYVRVLRMREGEYSYDRWIGDTVSLLARRLERIEVLDIYNLTWNELSVNATQALTAGFSSSNDRGPIRALRVGTCYWEYLDDFVDFICGQSFSGGLRALVCDSVLLNCGHKPSEGTIGSPTSHLRTLPRTLECLFLSIPEETMLRWFGEQEALVGLKKLGLIVRETESTETVAGGVVEKAWSSLEDLVLELPHGCQLSVTRNTKLKTLNIYIPSIAAVPGTTSNLLVSIPELISNISSLYLQTITIHLNNNSTILIWPWHDFIRSLNTLSLPVESTDSGHPKQVLVTFVVRNHSGLRTLKPQIAWITDLMQRGYATGPKSWRWRWKTEPQVLEGGEQVELWRGWV